MFIYNDNDLDNVSLSFTERENGIEFYIEGFDEDNKISIDLMVSLNIDYLKTMEIDFEYDLTDQLFSDETYLGINSEFVKTEVSVTLMKDLDERYFLRVVNDSIDANASFELEEPEEEEEDE
ncbi:MAG: hypothetical protein IKZ96_02275 [Bacilli bacterium]|nr:hypothetical protein [Bacilli bacterium]